VKLFNSIGPRPEDFPIGSIESRAAARAFAEAKRPRMFRLFRDGVLSEERECEGIELDIHVNIIRVGGRNDQPQVTFMPNLSQFDVPLQAKQIELLDLLEAQGATIIGNGGSKGSAKSHGGRAVMLIRRLKYPGTAGIIVRRKWKQHRESTLESGYFKDFPFMRDWWQESRRMFILPNGSRIVLGYAEHPGDIDDFQGHEYMDVQVEEAARFSEIELVKLNELRRWTGKLGGRPIPDWLCKTLWLMNPGGPGHSYIRRVMYKHEYHGHERAENYRFLQAYSWDNVEWSRAALAEANLSDKDYYSWTDKERFKFFIERTQRGRELDALPHRLRTGWLLGNWDEFAGQFFDIWDEDRFVKRCQPDKSWHPRWLGIDWGFQHPLSCHWLARDGKITKIYREYVANLHSARAQAQEIVDKTPPEERKLIEAIYLSPDAFQKRTEQDSVADQMGEIFRANGMPWPTAADDDRKHGSQLMYELMAADELEVDPSCKKLREVIPMVCTEEDDPEEIEKFEGDDAFDSARYALKSRERPRMEPEIDRVKKGVTEYFESRGRKLENQDPDTIARITRRALWLEREKRRKRWRLCGGLGRPWRPGAKLDSPQSSSSSKPQYAQAEHISDWQSEDAREARIIDYGKYLGRRGRTRRR
jgi:hypothetical protein